LKQSARRDDCAAALGARPVNPPQDLMVMAANELFKSFDKPPIAI